MTARNTKAAQLGHQSGALRVRGSVLLASICATALAAGPAASAAEHPSLAAGGAAVSVVSHITATQLIQSNGNLYWAANVEAEFSPTPASVYRTSKSGTPGSERLLYRVPTGSYFRSLTYAKVGGVWSGYFIAEEPGATRIKRIPLAGGAATVVATLQQNSGANHLVNDGTTLFWSDSAGVRAMPIGGGAVRILASRLLVQAVGLDAFYVYFVVGNNVLRVGKTGGAIGTVVAGSSAITAMYVYSSAPTVIYWGERSGVVKSHAVGGVPTTVYQPIQNGRYTTSVSFDGTHVRWADCTLNTLQCAVRVHSPGGDVSLLSASGAHDVQGDATGTFWADSDGVKRYTT